MSAEFRAGWRDTQGRWHAFTLRPKRDTRQEAQADLIDIKALRRNTWRPEVLWAIQRGDTGVIVRFVEVTPYEPV